MSKSTPISQLKNRKESPMSEQAPSYEDDDQTIQDVLDSLNIDDSEQPYLEQYDNDESVITSSSLPHNRLEKNQSHAQLIADLKSALIVVVVFILSSKLPVQNIIYRYINLSNFPFADIIIKAIIAGVLFIVFNKLLVYI